jgi:hypothetical protein
MLHLMREGNSQAERVDPDVLESVLQATLREHEHVPLPPELNDVIRRYRGNEPDERIVSELVSAALGNNWSVTLPPEKRRVLCSAVARRLVDDEMAMQRLRRLLASGREGRR